MTNVSSSIAKLTLRKFLFDTAIKALEKEGWKVERISRAGKSSVRRIRKGSSLSKTVTIRTTQDTWIAFPRNHANDGWATLADVDYVVAASVDDREDPCFAKIHMIAADEMRARFDRAYAARMAANHTIPIGRGVWVSLYEREAADPVSFVGAGVGLDKSLEIARVPLEVGKLIEKEGADEPEERESDSSAVALVTKDTPLTIAQAKRGLALFLGVHIDAIKITVST